MIEYKTLLNALEIVKELTERHYTHDNHGTAFCFYCNAYHGDAHDEDCIVLRAEKIMKEVGEPNG